MDGSIGQAAHDQAMAFKERVKVKETFVLDPSSCINFLSGDFSHYIKT